MEMSIDAKECPMCGERMRLVPREVVDRIPGTPKTTTTRYQEWLCPECDYFEESEGTEG